MEWGNPSRSRRRRRGQLLGVAFLASLPFLLAYLYLHYAPRWYQTTLKAMAGYRSPESGEWVARPLEPHLIQQLCDRLLSESSLRALTVELRLAVKKAWVAKLPSTHPLKSVPLEKQPAQFAEELGQITAFLHKRGLETTSPLETWVAGLEPVILARALGVSGISEGEDTPAVGDANLFLAMQRLVLPQQPQSPKEEVLRAAQRLLIEKLTTDPRSFPPEIARLLREDLWAGEILASYHLDTVATDFFMFSDRLLGWVQTLRQGLQIQGEGLIVLHYRESARQPEELLGDLILTAAFTLLKEDHRRLTTDSFSTTLRRAEEERERYRQQLTQAEADLALLQKEGLAPSAVTHPLDAAIEKVQQELQEIEKTIAAREAEANVSDEYLENPETQTIQTTIRRQTLTDSPRIRALREEKQEKEIARKRLLARSTDRHPLVRKLTREIQEIEKTIRELRLPEEPVEETILATNPHLVEWGRARNDLQGVIEGLYAQREIVKKNLQDLQEKRQAWENARKAYEQKQSEVEALRQEFARADTALALLRERKTEIQLQPTLEIHTPPLLPPFPYSPNAEVIWQWAVGASLGLLLLSLLLLSFPSRPPSPLPVIPDLPLLGSISRFQTPGGRG